MKDINDVVTVGEVAAGVDEWAEVIRVSDGTFLADRRMTAAMDNMADAIVSGRRKALGVTGETEVVAQPGEIIPTDPNETTVGQSGVVR